VNRIALLIALLAALAAASPALAAGPEPWNGDNPFVCELQPAGFEATGKDPKADPYCVDFNKTRQNVTELGVVEFVSLEPARVAAATDKCFYFQSDHWRGSIVQDDGSTKTYEWDGHYFFDKARGEGGAWVTNFNVNGQTGDPTAIPGFPADYAQYFGPGTGGVRAVNGSIDADPACAARAKKEPEKIYAASARRPGEQKGFATAPEACRAPAGGRVTSRSLGPVRLRDTEAQVRSAIGPPAEIRRGFLRYCDRGAFLVGQRGDRSGDLGGDTSEPTVIVVARAGRFAVRGLRLGAKAKKVRGRRAGKVAGTRVVVLRRAPVAVGVKRGRIAFIAVFDRRVIRKAAGLRIRLRRALMG
jgi:hypothetical protein